MEIPLEKIIMELNDQQFHQFVKALETLRELLQEKL